MILAWNCRGLGTTSTVRNLRFQCKKYNLGIVFLSETKMQRDNIEKARRKLNFENSVYFDPIGRSGGLALWWRNGIDLVVSVISRFIIHIDKVHIDGIFYGAVSCVYGPCDLLQKRRWWSNLANLRPGNLSPWAVIGDFNEMLYHSDKEGGRAVPLRELERFRSFMSNCDMMELETKGCKFTWQNMREGEGFIRECLDRVVVNGTWRNLFSKGVCQVLEMVGSDHAPIILNFEQKDSRTAKLFRFDQRWLEHPELEGIVKTNWDAGNNDISIEEFAENLKMLGAALDSWSNKEYGNQFKEVKKILKQINELMSGPINGDKVKVLAELKAKLEETWKNEELYWAQKSRVQWLKCGDRNTKFFHIATIMRRCRNRISRLRITDDVWVESEEEIGQCFNNFYSDLFKTNGPRDFSEILQFINLEVMEADNEDLMRSITKEEVKIALFNLG